MKQALKEYVVKGITTNIPYLLNIIDHPEFRGGNYDTGFLLRQHEGLVTKKSPEDVRTALLAAAVYAHQKNETLTKKFVPPTKDRGATSAWRARGRRG